MNDADLGAFQLGETIAYFQRADDVVLHLIMLIITLSAAVGAREVFSVLSPHTFSFGL